MSSSHNDPPSPNTPEHDPDDPYDRYASWAAEYDDPADVERAQSVRRRRGRPTADGPRLVGEGRSGRVSVEAESVEPLDAAEDADRFPAGDLEPLTYSTYVTADHGPEPLPDWVLTSANCVDTPLGVVKTGKEADVHLLDRSLPGGEGSLLAVKTYRSAEHRMFHRDAGYLEGRRTRRSREMRAMAKRTQFGRDLLSGRWAAAEFAALSTVWSAGGRVPYPVQLIGSELMMEFIGDPDGTAAPRLADHDTDPSGWTELWHDLVATLEILAEAGMTHGDLSAYNILATDDGCVVIDLPQVVDLIANPQGIDYLHRDCTRVADFFSRRGVLAADASTLTDHLWQYATGSDRRPDLSGPPLPETSSE
ncbi:RIO1 family regulatory kinase/ATPase [Nakamurella sp. A5-74]|uniref:non-specific serine/threonine protein kinase n=1 Tax=Nakamurella sp. A5-74 TaxID=3158264 RepID=A0AAU8DJL3_9ACTN